MLNASLLLDINLAPYFQILFAMLLGIVIGLERRHAGKMAGMRTYALVSAGACFLVLIPLLTSSVTADPLRFVQGILTGIGFLGAGIIMHKDAQLTGLTTAAGIWVATAIGIAVGMGLFSLAVFVTILTVFILTFVGRFEAKFVTPHTPGN
ncbi:MAG: MgtC/SapB family protein [Candidatus Paceibacterota bacterium]|jgi:putative Mg2+ transporter-C (MgtC) family protein